VAGLHTNRVVACRGQTRTQVPRLPLTSGRSHRCGTRRPDRAGTARTTLRTGRPTHNFRKADCINPGMGDPPGGCAPHPAPWLEACPSRPDPRALVSLLTAAVGTPLHGRSNRLRTGVGPRGYKVGYTRAASTTPTQRGSPVDQDFDGWARRDSNSRPPPCKKRAASPTRSMTVQRLGIVSVSESASAPKSSGLATPVATRRGRATRPGQRCVA
jgi:hypothetical protein